MSTRRSRKTANPRAKAPEPIITRTKSRQLRNKQEKRTEKPELTKPVVTKADLTKTETKSTKVVKTVKRTQESLLKPIVVEPDDVQVEYYPNTLKRDIRAKKVMLKPKHNFKVIATTNKRKLAIPQRGTEPPLNQSPQNSKPPRRSKASAATCPELSMQDMVRMMDETRSLSDEDFMEILTCPSPVWWEDPPDGGFDEDSIHTRSPETPLATIANKNKKRKLTNTASNSYNSRAKRIDNDTDFSKEKFKTTDEKFVKKKQKLENILGNIKHKTIQTKNEVENDTKNRKRMLSDSEGDFSDLSFNEEEILKNLEEMEIPMEQTPTESNHSSDVKSEMVDVEVKEQNIETKNNEVVPKNDNVDREILSIQIKEEIKEEFLIRSPVFVKDSIFTDSEFISSEENSFIKKSDEVVSIDSSNSSPGNSESNYIVALDSNSNSNIGTKILKDNSSNEIVPNKKAKDLSEFITVYKITPDVLKHEKDSEKLKLPENTKTTKIETVRGKLNDFFKQCKSNNIRLKKMENSIPAIPLTDVKEAADNEKKDGDSKIDLEDEKNRLKSCDYCVVKTEKGTMDFSCEKCEMAPILPCNLCNFVADTKEVYKKHVSSCKDVARISWNHNYLLNQT